MTGKPIRTLVQPSRIPQQQRVTAIAPRLGGNRARFDPCHNLYDLFQDFSNFSADPIGQGFLRLQPAGANVILQFDSDGGGDSFVNLVSLTGPPDLTLADIIYQQAPLPA